MKIFLIGMMGSGKSYLCKQLAEHMKLACYDLDTVIEEQQQFTISKIFEEKGEEYFRNIEANALRTFSERDNFILATGGGTPCFHNNMPWMNGVGITVWLNEDISTLIKRLNKGKQHRPLIKDLPDEKLETYIRQKLEERNAFYSQAKFQYNSLQPIQNLIGNISLHNLY